MAKWRIYYDDDTTQSDEDGPWEAAPAHGVVCVVVRDPDSNSRWVVSGWFPGRDEQSPYLTCPGCGDHVPYQVTDAGNNDFYVKYPGSDMPFSTPRLDPFLGRDDTDESMVKYGRMVENDKWQKIMGKARKDPDFPASLTRRRATD
jgi:hypothetical protein